MNWIKNFEGDYVNIGHAYYLYIEYLGDEYAKPYEVNAKINGSIYTLETFGENGKAQLYLHGLIKQLSDKDSHPS